MYEWRPSGHDLFPLLFNVYTEPLLESLNGLPGLVGTPMFADDLLILAEDWEAVSVALNVIEEWAGFANMLVNKAKSGLLVFDGRLPTITETCGYPVV